MSKDKGTSIFDELDSRLDDFFSENDSDFSETDDSSLLSADLLSDSHEADSGMSFSESSMSSSSDSPLDSLKAIVLEMDWEINDENLANYLEEIDRLMSLYSDDRPIYLFLKLHNSIGKYMLCRKAGAHPDALKFLYQVFNSLEKVIKNKYSVFEKNKLILNEVNNFKSLKARMFPHLYSTMELQTIPEKKKVVKPDFSKLPEEVQQEINKYIENEIAAKIQALKNEILNK